MLYVSVCIFNLLRHETVHLCVYVSFKSFFAKGKIGHSMYFMLKVIRDLYGKRANVEKETSSGPVWPLIYYHHLLGITSVVIDIDW